MAPVFVLSYLALWVVVVFQGLVLLRVLRALGKVSPSTRASAGPVATNAVRLGAGQPTPGALTGQPAPHFTVDDAAGDRVDSAAYDGQRRLMVFVAPTCPTCADLYADLEGLSAEYRATVVLACIARPQPCRQLAEQHELTCPLLVDSDAVLAKLFGISMTPTAVLIDADNIVGSYRHLGRSDDPTQLLQQVMTQLSALPKWAPEPQGASRP